MKAISINFFAIGAIVLFAGCASVKTTVEQAGKVNMISTRNVNMGGSSNYTMLKSYMGLSDKEKKAATATTIDEAIDATVKNTAGGEYLTNVKFYVVHKTKKGKDLGTFFAVEGDVWGIAGLESMRGFKVGDLVQWKEKLGNHKGKITGITDSENVMVKEEGKDFSKPHKMDDLVKVSE